MTTSSQIKALLKSYKDGDDSRFQSIALQIASHEAQKGHEKLAEEIKQIVGKFKERIENKVVLLKPTPIIEPSGELEGLFEAEYSKTRLNSLVLSETLERKLNRIIEEQNSYNKLREYGLLPRSKILMVGEPGTGKTMTASALAGQLNLPLFKIQLDALLTKYMGETSAKLRLIFNHIKRIRGVYFFDEFDAIGSSRNLGNDVGEIRRILNTFLQFIESSRSDSIILAATNYSELLDKALFRRFDDVLRYELPTNDLAIIALKRYLAPISIKNIDLDKIKEKISNLNYAEIAQVCENAIKFNILKGEEVKTNILLDLIDEIKSHKLED